MKLWPCVLIAAFSLFGTERLQRQVIRDFTQRQIIRDFTETQVKQDYANWAKRIGSWDYQIPGNLEAYLTDLAQRGVCPREHRGVYLDTAYYEVGIWCCRG